MNARATAGGPDGLAFASPGATSEGSLVRKLKKPLGAAGFFGGGGGTWTTVFAFGAGTTALTSFVTSLGATSFI